MANTALTFSFSTQALRAVIIDGEPWFVAADVCGALALDDTSKAVSRLDDDEKGTNTVRTPSGDQEMLIINESGLYSLILTSRKPEAKKFKKWVTAEVLPSIRKTGRYVATPAPVPAGAIEQLTAADMNNLSRVVWFVANRFSMEQAAAQGVWHHLRKVTNNPTPNRYTVEHIPVLAAELRRIITLSDRVRSITRKVEEQAIRQLFRRGDTADKVLQSIEAQANKALAQELAATSQFPRWMEYDMNALLERRHSGHHGNYLPEQPDFFQAAA